MTTQGNIQECDGYAIDLSDTKSPSSGVTVYRIYATKPRLGGLIPAGTLGGYISSPDNLSGAAWVDETSMVIGADARVMDNSCVMNDSQILGYARIMGNAVIRDTSVICDQAKVGHSAVIRHSIMLDQSTAFGSACVYFSYLRGNSRVTAGATVISSNFGGYAVAHKKAVVIACKAAYDDFFTDDQTYRGE